MAAGESVVLDLLHCVIVHRQRQCNCMLVAARLCCALALDSAAVLISVRTLSRVFTFSLVWSESQCDSTPENQCDSTDNTKVRLGLCLSIGHRVCCALVGDAWYCVPQVGLAVLSGLIRLTSLCSATLPHGFISLVTAPLWATLGTSVLSVPSL